MLKTRKRRLYLIFSLVAVMSMILGIALYILRNHISLYYTPHQVFQKHVPANQHFQLGGLVVKGSVHYTPHTLLVGFSLTDLSHQQIKVTYKGILPSLFREGQGIIASGVLNKNHVFIANQVLAKHDSHYHPPGIYKHSKKISKSV